MMSTMRLRSGPLPGAVALATTCLLGLGTVLQQRWGGSTTVKAVDDLGQLAFAWIATGVCWLTFRRSTGRRRTSWAALTVALGMWGAGQLVWCYYELLNASAEPFPSFADAGFLVFPPAAMVGLWFYPSAGTGARARARLVLDGSTVAASLFLISWATALGAVYHGGGESAFAFTVSMAYPLGDLALLTMAILVLARSTARRRLPLLLMGCGMAAMAFSDSAFTYLNAIGDYHTGALTDLGWPAAFALLAIAAVADRDAGEHVEVAGMPSRTRIFLPYAMLPVAVAVIAQQLLTGSSIDLVERVSVGALLILVFVRQLVTVAENTQLVREVELREGQLRHQAFHDPLTGLANRALFDDRLNHAVELHRRDAGPLSVLLLDLDDFKTVNDTLGHPAGDELLVKVAERLRACLRSSDTIARLGGDEFGLLLEAGPESPREVAQRVLGAFSQPFALAAATVRVRSSIGLVADGPDIAELSAVEILRDADIAMYVAKRNGKGSLAIFAPAMRSSEVDDNELKAELGVAVENGDLHVAYQPIRNLETYELWGVEALARWCHRSLGELTASRFLPLAEQAGLTSLIDDQIMEQACRQFGAWLREGLEAPVALTINVSAARLADPAYPQRVAAVLIGHGVPADRVVIEITESTMIADLEAAGTVTGDLRRLGIRLAIDDFGTGYSSLSLLDHLPVNVLKIHESFARKAADQDRGALVSGIVEMSRVLGIIPVAEGIETREQQLVVRGAGCLLGQGFYLGRPVGADGMAALLHDRHDLREKIPGPATALD